MERLDDERQGIDTFTYREDLYLSIIRPSKYSLWLQNLCKSRVWKGNSPPLGFGNSILLIFSDFCGRVLRSPHKVVSFAAWLTSGCQAADELPRNGSER
jgi:hypothetical protein